LGDQVVGGKIRLNHKLGMKVWTRFHWHKIGQQWDFVNTVMNLGCMKAGSFFTS
jgi:hypothetical protein